MTNEDEEKRIAFQEILEYRRQHPFPKDFDWEKAREEAMREKYGAYFPNVETKQEGES